MKFVHTWGLRLHHDVDFVFNLAAEAGFPTRFRGRMLQGRVKKPFLDSRFITNLKLDADKTELQKLGKMEVLQLAKYDKDEGGWVDRGLAIRDTLTGDYYVYA